MEAGTLILRKNLDERHIGREDPFTILAPVIKACVEAAGVRIEGLGDAQTNVRLFRTGTRRSLTVGDAVNADPKLTRSDDALSGPPAHLERAQTWARREPTRRAA